MDTGLDTRLPMRGRVGVRRSEHVVPVPGGFCLVTLDRPAGPARALVVCAHGLTGDRCGPADLLARWSLDLATAGYSVARLDFRGSGDSSGSWWETTFDGMRSDLDAVVDWSLAQCDQPRRLVLAGLSTGGVIATMAAAGRTDVTGLLLMSSDFWEEPEPAVFVEPVRRGEFHEPAAMPVERARLRAHAVLAGLACPKLLIYGDRDSMLMAELSTLKACGVEAQAIAGTGHLFEGEPERIGLGHLVRAFLDRVAA